MSHTTPPRPYAEILHSRLTQWTAECWYNDTTPQFGECAVVATDTHRFFGYVADIQTDVFDRQRPYIPYGKEPHELRRDHPELYALLTTRLECIFLCFQSINTSDLQFTPAPHPPPLHAFVRPATHSELAHIGAHIEKTVATLCTTSHHRTSHERVIAFLATYARSFTLDTQTCDTIIDTYARHVNNDYHNVRAFVADLQPLWSCHERAEVDHDR